MKASLFTLIDRQASEFRQQVGLSDTEAVNIKSLLLKLNILTIYRPLSNSFSGMSLKGSGNERFMLINSNQPRCRQHFTIAHELFHLYVEKDPTPHKCEINGNKDVSEQCADAFAQRFLMPYNGILQLIPDDELANRNVTFATLLRMEHYFSVSRQAMIYRLYDLKFLSREQREVFLTRPVISSARDYGFDTTLYQKGNEGLVIGDYGEKARKLFEEEKISEGHYYELMKIIGFEDAENEDSTRCGCNHPFPESQSIQYAF